VLHSGSRGPGNRIGTDFTRLARDLCRQWFVSLPDPDLAYLPEGTEVFHDYLQAVRWAQGVAGINRELMMTSVLACLPFHGGSTPLMEQQGRMPEPPIDCAHNYVEMESHQGKNMLVTRKGAIRARLGDMGIIPGSMGARSFIVRGLGNSNSLQSCSHGAGRAMSRTEALRRFTVADHEAATRGIVCAKDEGVLDETPGAYKDIDAVMRAQHDLVEIVHTLRQIVVVKGGKDC
jgi:tRNA-splicing ligase RtcB (3'-phosphate/5'-hydroxy nucleic acid ligase)